MLMQDLRYAFRALFRTPVFTAIAVLCLSLGIGVNTMIFGVVDGVLVQSLPYQDAERLVIVQETFHRGNIRESGLSYKNLLDWKERNTVFTTIAGVQYPQPRPRGRRRRAGPLLGRGDLVGSLPDARLVRGAWPDVYRGGRSPRRRAGGRSSATRSFSGATEAIPPSSASRVLVNARPHTVVGVMPPNFEFPENQKLYIPLAPLAHDRPRTERGLFPLARLKDGVTVERAGSELTAIAAQLAKEYPVENDGWGAVVLPLHEEFIPDDVELIIWTMMGAVTLVLLIACANIANLLIARASVRQREISIRAALGAGRWRIVRQLLTEAILLGLMAAPIGMALAVVGLRWLDSAMPARRHSVLHPLGGRSARDDLHDHRRRS